MMGMHITYIQFLSMWVIDDLEWKEYLTYNIVCYYIQQHQPRGYDALKFEVACLGFYTLQHYYKMEIAYEDYYCRHQTSASSKPTFIMTQMEAILGHVESKAKTQHEKWK